MTQQDRGVHMVCQRLDSVPKHVLPEGFTVRWYEPGDERIWLDIHYLSERIVQITPELYAGQFGTHPEEIPRRQFFILDATAAPVGTTTAWFDPNYHGGVWGRIHWVAIVPGWQGRGLSKPMLSIACQRLRELGHERATLATSTTRIPAINLYLRFGFVPDVRSPEDREVWQSIEGRLKLPVDLRVRED